MMKSRIILMSLAVLFIAVSCEQKRPTEVKLETEIDTISYCFGINLGEVLNGNKVENINIDAVTVALDKMLKEDSTIQISAEEARVILQTYFQKKEKAKFEKNKEAGAKFLEENKKKEGVVTLESGLQYKVLKEGNGEKPTVNDRVTTHYKGTLIDGRVFDSSEGKDPVTFPVNGVIKGWQEALPLMSVGSKWELYVPYNLAYNDRQIPGSIIEPYSTLIFEIELLEIDPAPADEKNK